MPYFKHFTAAMLAASASLFVISCESKSAHKQAGNSAAKVTLENENQGQRFKLEAWADNWFSAWQGEELIVEDSVSITTERSFNAETAYFDAQYPIQLNVLMKDFKENDSGLEYIGSRRQQMGDGGFIAQLTDTQTGAVVSTTNSAWKCKVVHHAPIDEQCVKESKPQAGVGPCAFHSETIPEDWKKSDFDTSDWSAAIEYSAAAVRPKDGYDTIQWHPEAKLIWGPDLEKDNTLLCRLTIQSQSF